MSRITRCVPIIVLCSLALFGFMRRSFVAAHSGNDSGGVDAYDLDAPRVISPEAAKLIGLKTAPVARGAIRDVLQTSGTVKALPDRIFAAAPRFAGNIRAVAKNLGDTVKAGDILFRIDSPEIGRNAIEARRLEAERQKMLLEAERSKMEAAQIELTLQFFKNQVDATQKEYDRLVELKNAGTAVAPGDLSAREENLLRS